MNIFDSLQKLMLESGFASFFTTDGGWKNLVMILIAFVLLYLGIVKNTSRFCCAASPSAAFCRTSATLSGRAKTPFTIPSCGRSSLTKRAHIITATAT